MSVGKESARYLSESPEQLLELVEGQQQHFDDLDELAYQYEVLGPEDRDKLLFDNPDLAEWLEFMKCRQSVPDAKRSAIQNEGQIVIL